MLGKKRGGSWPGGKQARKKLADVQAQIAAALELQETQEKLARAQKQMAQLEQEKHMHATATGRKFRN